MVLQQETRESNEVAVGFDGSVVVLNLDSDARPGRSTGTLDRDARPGRTVVLDARPRIPLSPTQILYMYANANCKFTADLAWTDKAVGPRTITFALAGRLDCMGAGHILYSAFCHPLPQIVILLVLFIVFRMRK